LLLYLTILRKAIELIANSRCGIYDISYWWHKKENQWKIPGNVLIELGIAIALNRPTLLLRNKENQTLELPECFKSISHLILEFGGESSLIRILKEHLPHWINKSPEKSWWNRYCFLGNQVCQYRETHPQLKQFGKQNLNCPILDTPNINYQDFRDLTEEILNRFSNITYTYIDNLCLTEGYQFLLCNHCQTIRSSPFAIYQIAPSTPPEVFIALGMSIALEKQFEYEIPRIIMTEELTNIPSLLGGYEVIKAESDKEKKRQLSKFIPAVLNKVRETSWKPRSLPFIDSTNLVDEENKQEEQRGNEIRNFQIEQTIYIGNLSYEITEEDLREVFAEYGTVEQVYLAIDSQTNRKRDFAFIAMSTKKETAKAAETLDGAEWVGRELTVRIATLNEVNTLEPDSFSNENTALQELEKALDNLSPRERDVIRLRYGLDDGRRKTIQEIASIFNVDISKVIELGRNALQNLKKLESISEKIIKELEFLFAIYSKEKVRIYELAKEFNLDNRDIKDICEQLNISVKSHSSILTFSQAERVIELAAKYTPDTAVKNRAKNQRSTANLYRNLQELESNQGSIRVLKQLLEIYNTNVYIGNLNYEITERDLREVFSEYGTVKRVSIPTDRETGRKRGFGFVEMETETEANKAIEVLDGAEWMGRQIRVNQAKPRTTKEN
jgi:RNA polymerase sigma factor (sigma-70 family)